MNDIDIEEGRRLQQLAKSDPDGRRYDDCVWTHADDFEFWLDENAAAMFDAIETGRQWETIARRLALYPSMHTSGCGLRSGRAFSTRCTCGLDDAIGTFRVLADRTPTPTDGA